MIMQLRSCLALSMALAAWGCSTSPKPVEPAQHPTPRVATPAPRPAATPTDTAPLDTDAAFRKLACDICRKLAKHDATDSKQRLAVYYFYAMPGRRRNAAGEYIASMLPCFLEEAGQDKVDIFTRRHLSTVLKEHGYQTAETSDESTQVALGKLQGAQHIVCGSLYVFPKHYELAVKLVDVETGQTSSLRGKLPKLGIPQGPLIQDVDKHCPAERDAQGSPAAKIIARGDHYYDQGQDEKAFREYEEAEDVDPELPRVLFRLGYLHQHLKGNRDTALAYYDRFIKVSPKEGSNCHKGLNNRGVIRMDKRDAGAMDDFSKAIAAKPKYAAAYANRAKCRVELLKKDLDKAVADLKKAIELEPKTASHHYNLGVLQYQLQQYDEAVQALGAAIVLNPKDKLAYCARAGVYVGPANKPKLAEKDLTAALEIDPKYVDALYNRGIVRCYKLNQKDAGVADLKKCLELDTAGKYSEAARQALDAIK